MAIKVNGTTVIDDSRNLVNIASGAGASTTFGAVGTYAQLSKATTALTEGDTLAGSGLFPASFNTDSGSLTTGNSDSGTVRITSGTTSVSGTWRVMGSSQRWAGGGGYTIARYPLCVRIS